MCLIRSTVATNRFLKRNKGKRKVIVWKVVSKSYITNHKIINEPTFYFTLYRNIIINTGWFEAYGKPSTKIEIGVGAIHVYTTRKEARLRSSWYTHTKVIRCEALMEDFIAAGSGEACFTKIYIPKMSERN